jgi:hypothetical protein
MSEREPAQVDGPAAAAGRPPAGPVETVTANFRPQPAIPAVLVFVLAVLFPVLAQDPRAEPGTVIDSWLAWLVPAGIVASCGLAIAAGFCSLFPQAVWIALAAWGLGFTTDGPLPAYNAWLFIAGIAVCAVMFGVQVYRVATGQFVPTIRDEPDPAEDG